MEITLEENKKRNDKLHAYYNPITGEGSLLDRFPLHFNNNSVIYLPNSMREKWEIKGNLEDKQNFPELAEQIHHERLDHDFEFWAFVCVKIKPKEGGDPIPFKLNGPQRKLLKELEAMRIHNLPIRAIIVKARQWGGSTMIQIYMAWIQTRHKTNWNSLIAAHINQAATNIRFMYSTLQKYYPKEIDDFTLKAFEGTTNIKFIPERSNKITIGSMQTPDSIRSDDVSMCHLCLKPGTLIPTKDGFLKKVEDLSINDVVITHTGKESFVRCVTGNKPDWRNGDGQSIIIKTWLGFDTEMTPNHPIYTYSGWKNAEDVTKNDFLSLPIRPIKNEITHITLPSTPPRKHGGGRKAIGGGEEIVLNKDFGFTVGYFLAEGHASVKKSKNGNIYKGLIFTCHDDDIHLTNKAVDPIRHCASKTHIKNRPNCKTSHQEVFSSVLAEWFYKNLGKKEYKRVPDWFFNTNKEFLEGVLQGYLWGDGNRKNYNSGGYQTAYLTVTTISSSLAIQMRDIALSLGYGLGSLKIKEAGLYYGRNCKKAYILSWAGDSARKIRELLGQDYPKNGHNFSEKSFIEDGYVWVKVKNVSKGSVDIVYDVEVDHPDHSFRTALFSVKNSEVGLWKKTEGKSPEDMAQSILGTIPSVPYSVYILESTGKGSGNYFHRAWKRAVSKESNLVPVFVSWFEIPQYQMPFNDDKERQEFISTLSEYELYLWDIGATLEGIKWYRWKLKEYEGDTWRMQSEFPSTSNESFQSTGRRVYNPAYIQSLRIHERPPILMGDIFPSIHKENRGKKAFEDLVIKDTTNGALSVWRMPNDPPAPAGFTVTDRYAIAADIGGRTKDADYSTISVLDRYWMLEGGDPDFIMTWRGHIDQDIFAWKCAQLGWLLDQGLLAIEVNSLRKQKDTEGEHFHTVLDEIAEYYPNLFMRNNPEQAREGTPNRYGFHTNVQSKGMIIDNFNQSARDETFIDYDERANDEADYYEVKEDGTVGAVDGQHDDIHMGRAIALWLGQKYMEPPKLVPIKKGTARGKNVKTSVFL